MAGSRYYYILLAGDNHSGDAVDLGYFLKQRLSLIEYFYETSAHAFRETKRKINCGEEPFIDTRSGEEADEPAFLKEYEMAHAALQMAGAAALESLQATLHVYLHAYMVDTGNEEIIPRLKQFGKSGWLANYRAFFADYLKIDWQESGSDLDLIEQIVLARNDFVHGGNLFSFYTSQGKEHEEKFPDAVFIDPIWKEVSFFSNMLVVSPEALNKAIEQVRLLCSFLETRRTPQLKVFRFRSEKASDHEIRRK